MKKKNLLCLVALVLCSFSLMAQDVHFVNHAAQGANDGSTWENAFTSLDSALARAQGSDLIWIAKGTYKPGGDNGNNMSRFTVDKTLRIFGGFAGNETNVDERDVEANPVILSGDHMDNDESAVDSVSRVDNSWHIMHITPDIPITVRLTDLIFGGGSTRDNRDLPLEFAGGAILAESQILVTNCHFANNYGLAGGCVALLEGASISQFVGCTFVDNFSDAQSACVFLDNCHNVAFEDCVFSDNTTTRGVIYPLNSFGTEINRCNFTNNDCLGATAFGGAFFSWNSINTNISNSTFIGNDCGNGGVAYIDGRELEADDISVIWNNCTIEQSRATDWGGGAIYNWRSTQYIRNCTFKANTATNTGGAIYNGGNDKQLVFDNTDFIDNVANGGWGGAHAIYGDSTEAVINGCFYQGNSAITSGGAVTSGFKSKVRYISCSFESNMATFGGASYTQNDSTNTRFDSCMFLGNNAGDLGGAVTITAAGEHAIEASVFELNVCDMYGGAISISDPDTSDADVCNMWISNTRFFENLTEEQGAAILANNPQMTLSNVEITDNTCLGSGSGAAISHYTFGGVDSRIDIINSTLANNFGAEISGISSNNTGSSVGTISVANSILHHPGGQDWGIELGNAVLESQGGNLVSDINLNGVFSNTNDHVNEDPNFADESNGDYRLDDNSIAVNNGITALAPPQDIFGNDRVGEADKGAHENQTVVSTKSELEPVGLKVTPNPVAEQLNATFDLPNNVKLIARVYSQEGRLIMTKIIDARAKRDRHTLDVRNLPAGEYYLEVRNPKYFESIPFIKI